MDNYEISKSKLNFFWNRCTQGHLAKTNLLPPFQTWGHKKGKENLPSRK